MVERGLAPFPHGTLDGQPERNVKMKNLVAFFLLTFGITWGLAAFATLLPDQFAAVFGPLTGSSPIFYFAVAAPSISATLLTLLREGWSGLGTLYGRLIRWRFGFQWYALVLVGFPLVGWLVTRFIGSEQRFNLSTPALVLGLLFSLLISGPLGEELGWRGYALPRLLARFRPLPASLILGLIWGIWHVPSFFLSGMVQAQLSLALFLLAALGMSVLVTWLFQHTGGSVLMAVLFHYMVNFGFSVIGVPMSAFSMVVLAGAALVVLLDKDWRASVPGRTNLAARRAANDPLAG